VIELENDCACHKHPGSDAVTVIVPVAAALESSIEGGVSANVHGVPAASLNVVTCPACVTVPERAAPVLFGAIE